MKKIILISTLFFIWQAMCFAKDYELKIHFIDVGEGESILIQNKNDSALIDTGNLLSGHKLLNYLKENNVTTINHLIITHHDLDHIMGIFFIVPRLNIENAYDNGFKLDSPGNDIYRYYEKIFRLNKSYRVLRQGDKIKLGDCYMEVIWPPDAPLLGSFNHNSLVIILEYNGFRCLFTADIDNAAEDELIKMNVDLHAEALKVAHHGAKDATGIGFIKSVNPALAVISVDKNNQRGYPAQSVLDLLSERKIKTYRTDISGSLIITVNNRGDYKVLP